MSGDVGRKKFLVKKGSKLKDPIVSLECLPDTEDLRTNDGSVIYFLLYCLLPRDYIVRKIE